MVEPVDPHSIPMLTDVMVPGRPAAGRPAESTPEPDHRMQAGTPVGAPEQPGIPQPSASGDPVAGEMARSGLPSTAEPTSGAALATISPPEPRVPPQAALDARDVESIAERLRSRFSTYLRRDARGVIEAHCREAIEEHTNWLVRQVTREVVSALEQEVAGWVRDAVRDELARHTSQR
jgi:hypothetical protein